MTNKTSTRIEKFIWLCFTNGGKVFGGFVRDMLSGDAPNDIDMLFPSMREAMEFFGACYKAGLVKGILPKPESKEIPLGYKLMGTFGSEHVMRFENSIG
jgi:tRNA nucleotidyltransferase/poly(A) polymerase